MSLLPVALVTSVFGAVLLGVGAGWLERRLPPVMLTRMCALAAVVCAGGVFVTFAMTGFAVLGRDSEVAEVGRWSPQVLRTLVPVPVDVGVAAGVVALAMILAGLRWMVLFVSDVVRAERACRRLPGAPGLPVVVEDRRPDAYTVAGVRARAVLTTGMLTCLPEAERRVVVAHELSHLRHRHDLYLRCVGLAAAVNPLLRPARAAVAHAVERWADEDAAVVVGGDRRVVARAVARAGLARVASRPAALGVASLRVGDRVRALLDPPRPARRHALVALCLLTALVAGVAVQVESQVEDGVEIARQAVVSVP